MNSEEIKKKLLKARTQLLLDHPFWGVLAIRLKLEEAEWCETAATDAVHLFYNPEYIKSLTLPETVGLIAHEVGHCSFGHLWRMEGKDHVASNVAGDLVLNQNLVDCKFSLPKGALLDPAFKGLSIEEAYHKLPKNPGGGGQNGKNPKGSGKGKQQGKCQGDQQGPQGQNGTDPGKAGAFVSPKGLTKEQKDQMKADWKAAVNNAARTAKSRGDLPAGLEIAIEEVLDPPLPWTTLLRDFLERSARNDYCWTVPNRRYLQMGFVLPSLVSEEIPEIDIGMDTSGSTRGFLPRFCSEASAVLGAYRTTLRVIHCDADVHKEEVYMPEDLPLNIKPQGGGGTDFRPVFNHVAKQGYTPTAMIFFTDGYGVFPDEPPEYPVLWIVPKGQLELEKFPFGTAIQYIDKE